MSFNWADEVEEELAEAAGQEKPISQVAKAQQEKTQIVKIDKPIVTPKVESEEVRREPTSSTAQLQRTPSPEAQPSARNSGIMQSRWATAPDEPVVNLESEVTKDSASREQGGTVIASPARKPKKARGTSSGKRETSQSRRPTGSPKKSNHEPNKQAKVKASNGHNEKAHVPATVVDTPPKSSGRSTPKAAKLSNEIANAQPGAKAVASGVATKTDGPAQTLGSSPQKNEISLSMWA